MKQTSTTSDIRILDVTNLGFGGDGMARDGDQTVFIPYAIPGDRVRVKVSENKQNQLWGRILDIVQPSLDRVSTPPCQHCFDCGGCALQQMSLTAYQAWKYQSVIDRLERGHLRADCIHPLIVIEAKTRRRATFCAMRERGQVILGFNRHHSDQVINLMECHVVVEPIMQVLPDLRTLMDVLLGAGQRADIGITLLDTGLDILVTGTVDLNLICREAIAEFTQNHEIARFSLRDHERHEAEVILQPRPAHIQIGGMTMTPYPGSFLQPSRQGEAALIQAVLAGVGEAMKVVDLFSGLGTFAFPLAERGGKVWAIDADGPGIRAASHAVQGTPLNQNVIFQTRNLYRDPVRAADLSVYDAIVFDPPRAGAKGQAIEIARAGVSKVVAVSCNPGTFVTDCAPLIVAGYQLTDLYVIDQFMWSAHVEIVGVFKKR